MEDPVIREAGQEEEFSAWFDDLLRAEGLESGEPVAVDDHWLVLTDEIGDWIGGLRYTERGGVAHMLALMVHPERRHQGHAHRLLEAFERHAVETGSHVLEFWTPDEDSEGLFMHLGWERVLDRPNYIGGRTWHLLEKRLGG
jgi:GNAT superfamily N-acetyltransferase